MENTSNKNMFDINKISQSFRKFNVRNFFVTNALLFLTVTGVIIGVIAGLYFRSMKFSTETILIISYPGEIFMRILKLLILPLIIASLISGSASLNAKMNGSIAMKTLAIFISTSLLNALFGVCLALLIRPGEIGIGDRVNVTLPINRTSNVLDSVLDLGRNLFPDNILEATFHQTYTAYEFSVPQILIAISTDESLGADQMKRVLKKRSGINTLGLAVFCLVFGTTLGMAGAKGRNILDMFTVMFDVIMKIVTGAMWFTPVGVASIITGKILSVDDLENVLSQLGWFILTVCIGVFFYQFIVLQAFYFLVVRKNPYKYYCGLFQATLTASVTSSTAAALPVTFRIMTDKLRIDPRISHFILPIGCNINMDGTALFIAISTVFITQMHGMMLDGGELFTVFILSGILSMSSASVPSAGLVLVLVSLAAVNAPTENVTLLFAIDWLVDRIRTTNNMLGDCYTTAIVDHLSKNELCKLGPVTESTRSDLECKDYPKSIDDIEVGMNSNV